MRRAPGGFGLVLAVALGCGDGGGPAGADRDQDADAEPPTAVDSGDASSTNGPGDAGAVPPPPGQFDAGDPGAPSAAFPAIPGSVAPTGGYEARAGKADGDDASFCGDFVDNDLNAAVDCADETCQRLRSCCVGSGSCCGPSPDPALGPALDFLSCVTSDAEACLAAAGVAATAFGAPLPRVEGGALLPGGDENYDSGIALGDSVDLTVERLEVSVTFGAAGGCDVSCLESAGVALSTQADLGAETEVRPRLALLLSGSRNDVSLLSGDQVVERWPLEADTESWRLVARPTGDVEVFRQGALVLAGARYLPARDTRLLVYGRNRSDSGGEPSARITNLSVAQYLCDMPTSWRDRAAVTVVDQASGSLAAPSLALGPDGDFYAAFEGPAGILVARRSGPSAYDAPGVPLGPDAARAYDEAGLRDPELLFDPGLGEWVLFYTAVDADGTRSVARATGDPETSFQADDVPVLAPDGTEVLHYEQPTVARRSDGEWAMVARVRLATGRTELRIYRSNDAEGGQIWTPFEGSDLARIVDPDAQIPEGFVVDEVADPSLVIHNGAWQLYFARRRGTRWSVGLAASHDLLFFRHINDGLPVFEGETSFDRVGARSPDVLVSGAQGTLVDLIYEASDGVRTTPARAERLATNDGTF